MSDKISDILICFCPDCVSRGAGKIKELFQTSLIKHNLSNDVNIIETGCMGTCDLGPVLTIYPEGYVYIKIKPEDVEELVTEHFLNNRPVSRLMLPDTFGKSLIKKIDIPFHRKQMKVIMENCGVIDPGNIEEYFATGGYETLAKILLEKSPEELIETLKRSGLRDREGGGFPSWQKWQYVLEAQDDPKYIIVNAEEGDPGVFISRALLESDPHRILEGMITAAFAIGAVQGYIYCRNEYPLAIIRIKRAVEQAREYGMIGENIFNSGFSFDVEIRRGAGSFVAGEETAVISVIEGLRGEPISKPEFPATSGLWKKPTLIHNVETIANLTTIFSKGASWFSSLGTNSSKGTKIFALSGAIRNQGLIEVPFGITLRELVYDFGGGMKPGKNFLAVQLGGPSGGCFTSQHFDIKIDYEFLQEQGITLGSGGVIVLDDSSCLVDLARYFLEFTVTESCGKCLPCRVGLRKMLEILNRITNGEGELEDLNRLESLGSKIKALSLCNFG